MFKRTAMCVASLWALACFPLFVCAQEATELQKEALERVEQLAAAKIQLVKTLKSVDDQATALAAVAQIRADWANVLKAMEKASAFLQEHGAVFEHNDELFMPTRAELSKAEEAFDAELKRLELHRGLPAELWNVILPALVREELLGALKPSRVAEPGNAEYVAQLKARLDLLEKHQPTHVLTLVVRQCGPETRPLVKKWLEDRVGAGATVDDQSSPEEPGTLRFLAGPVKDVKKMASTVNFGDVTRIAPERGFLEVEAEWDTAAAIMQAAEDPTALEALSAKMLREADVNSPDYHSQLADLLSDGMAANHDDAIETLLAMDPNEVKDKKVRGAIARGFRDLAYNPGIDVKAGIEGIVKWGGKHSVPMLVELVGRAGIAPAEQELYNGLAQYPTADGAEAVAGRLGHFMDRQKAMACLTKMGPVAEPSVIKVAPVDDLEINLFALEFFKTHGTAKCVTLLRRAEKSSNEQIKSAAKAALKEVQARVSAKEKLHAKTSAA
jgi:hypothetical protein